ncbi:lasso RiPP family leader peptide-containing protein [Kineococcus sp. SYSU DK005]|uniref:lasso RiPP family leader peptide-containing protein n=1 Tax=Kineococcus sp. SYSU DK005 TaxID=3383126 RepID=UPI003D7ECB82
MARPYEAPTLTTLGSLADLTLAPKSFGATSDGDFLQGRPLYTVSSCECTGDL